MSMERSYIAIDLKSFYASVECVERGLDPLTTHLVVADKSRTEKTICLAVTPPLKACGVPGRPRLFEAIQQVKCVNEERRKKAPYCKLSGKSYDVETLNKHPEMALDFIIAPPRMQLYMNYSVRIYGVYLRYIAPEDIHVYSVDEVFIDATPYLALYGMNAQQLATTMIHDVFAETGITATAGIGTNMYLCKVSMDIVAKHAKPDANGVRIAVLDEMSYRKMLWSHRPLTDFWRVGGGYARKLEKHGLYTMGDVARCSSYHEDLLYRLFGVNAELLIDHAWGWEPCTMAAIKSYQPSSNSLSTGQVLPRPYKFTEAQLIIKEMADSLVLDMVEKKLVTDQIVLVIGYDTENISFPSQVDEYHGEVVVDCYGRQMPKQAHGSINLNRKTSSGELIISAAVQLYERIVDPSLLIRRINVVASHVWKEQTVSAGTTYEQLDMFTDYDVEFTKRKEEEQRMANVYMDYCMGAENTGEWIELLPVGSNPDAHVALDSLYCRLPYSPGTFVWEGYDIVYTLTVEGEQSKSGILTYTIIDLPAKQTYHFTVQTDGDKLVILEGEPPAPYSLL